MNRKMKSLLGGAAVAAFVIAPSLASFGQTTLSPAASSTPAPPSLPSPPPAPPAPPATPAWTRHGNWAVAPVRSFTASSIKLDDVVGNVVVKVRDGGPVMLEVAGIQQRVNGVHASEEDGRLVVDGSSEDEEDKSVWDWHNWFNFPHDDDHHSGSLFITVTVPRGTDVTVEDLVGNATIGDTMGNLHFEAAASRAHIGKVAKASVSLGGSGRIDIASVEGQLNLDVGGAGKIMVGPTGSVKADIAGSGDATFGPIAGGLSLDIAGSGDVTATHVNGPVRVEIAGSGTVRIADGIANPLHVEIMGAGNLYFGGVAIDPHIEAVGSGSVHIKAYRGHLDSEGMADVKIGD